MMQQPGSSGTARGKTDAAKIGTTGSAEKLRTEPQTRAQSDGAPERAVAGAQAEGLTEASSTQTTVIRSSSPWIKYTRDSRSYYSNSKTKENSLEPPGGVPPIGVKKHANPYPKAQKFEKTWAKLKEEQLRLKEEELQQQPKPRAGVVKGVVTAKQAGRYWNAKSAAEDV